jgi:hypothetical protein
LMSSVAWIQRAWSDQSNCTFQPAQVRSSPPPPVPIDVIHPQGSKEHNQTNSITLFSQRKSDHYDTTTNFYKWPLDHLCSRHYRSSVFPFSSSNPSSLH